MLLFVPEQYCLPPSTTLPYLRVQYLPSLQYSLTSSTTFYITPLYFFQFQTTLLHCPVLSFTFENFLLPFSNPVLLALQCLLLPSNINYTLVHQLHLLIFCFVWVLKLQKTSPSLSRPTLSSTYYSQNRLSVNSSRSNPPHQ